MPVCHIPGYTTPLYYETAGPVSRPVLLFVHGVAEHGVIWQPVIELLSQDYYCIAVDLPGHGGSMNFRGNWSMNFYAQVLRKFMETMQLREVTLVAHSMGAQISAVLALQVSVYINAMIWVSPAGAETFSEKEAKLLKNFTTQYWESPPPEDLVTEKLKSHFSFSANLGVFIPKLAKYHAPEIAKNFKEVVIYSVSGMLDEPVHAYLPQLKMPVHVLIGERDLLVPNRWLHPALTPQHILDEAKRLLPNCRTSLVKNAGHFLPVEQPEVLADAVRGIKRDTV
ncbi:MAG: alpha/beta hydrolase [Bacteroidia bacterium]|jgi:pimeloyl-ACP methyl ester carboxylesterase|nr:alpha/beta hydrolase [Bacteroidia bacterium]